MQTMEFCKQYNAATENQRGQIIPVEITIYEDRSFTFVLKTPPTPCARARGRSGSTRARRSPAGSTVGAITDAQLTEIATIKLPDLNTDDIEAAKRQVAGHGPLDGRDRRLVLKSLQS